MKEILTEKKRKMILERKELNGLLNNPVAFVLVLYTDRSFGSFNIFGQVFEDEIEEHNLNRRLKMSEGVVYYEEFLEVWDVRGPEPLLHSTYCNYTCGGCEDCS